MKYILFILSIFLIIYPIYGLIRCLQLVGNLSNYGMGVLVGGCILIFSGIVTLIFTIKLFKQKNKVKV